MSEQDQNNAALTPELSAEDEILQAQKNLQAAKDRVAEATRLKLKKAEADIAAYKAEEERKLLVRKLEAEAIQKKWAAKKREEEETLLAQHRAEQQARAELEQRQARAEEALRVQREHEAEVKRLSDLAFAEEQNARQIEAELMRKSLPQAEEAKPVTLQSECHPLHFLFAGKERTASAEPDPVPHIEPTFAPELRKESSEEQQYVASVWNTSLNSKPNPNSIVQLLRRFAPSDVIAAVETVSKDDRFMTRDEHTRAVQALLWQSSTFDALVETLAAEQARREAEKKSR